MVHKLWNTDYNHHSKKLSNRKHFQVGLHCMFPKKHNHALSRENSAWLFWPLSLVLYYELHYLVFWPQKDSLINKVKNQNTLKSKVYMKILKKYCELTTSYGVWTRMQPCSLRTSMQFKYESYDSLDDNYYIFSMGKDIKVTWHWNGYTMALKVLRPSFVL